jgi:hypothetical protein
MPTTATNTFSGKRLQPSQRPQDALENAVNLAPSLNLARGTILGEITATPGTFKAYASGNSDGSQFPTAILIYDCQTDASGNITFSSSAGQVGGFFGQTEKAAPVYQSGFFQMADLVGLDANCLTAAGWRRVAGATGQFTVGEVALGS